MIQNYDTDQDDTDYDTDYYDTEYDDADYDLVRFPNCHECPVASGLGNLTNYDHADCDTR